MVKYGLVRSGKVLALRNKLSDLYEMQLTFKRDVNVIEFIYARDNKGEFRPVDAVRVDF
jgi:hypothetical protein